MVISTKNEDLNFLYKLNLLRTELFNNDRNNIIDLEEFKDKFENDEEFLSNLNLAIPAESILIINPVTGKSFNLAAFALSIMKEEDKELGLYFYSHLRGDGSKPSASASMFGRKIGFTMTSKIEDLFSILHEIGHYHDSVSDDNVFAVKAGLLFDENEIGKYGENPGVSVISKSERNAWSFVYRVAKELRKRGFVNFDDQDLIDYSRTALSTYQNAYQDQPNNFTLLTQFTSEARKEKRAELIQLKKAKKEAEESKKSKSFLEIEKQSAFSRFAGRALNGLTNFFTKNK